jgi:hypothetical protein
MSKARATLPPTVVEFLKQTVDGIEELEILLLLQRHNDRYWDAETAAEQLGLLASHVAAAFEMLAKRGLLDVRLTDAIRYRFNPATASQRCTTELLAVLWRTSRTSLLEAMATKRQSLKDFADAFILRKESDRG